MTAEINHHMQSARHPLKIYFTQRKSFIFLLNYFVFARMVCSTLNNNKIKESLVFVLFQHLLDKYYLGI